MNALTQFADNTDTSASNEISVFKDPFQQDCIDEIVIRYRRPIFKQNRIWEGTVFFKNGLTAGKQATPECESWEELMIQMKAIYQSLNVEPK